MTSFQDPNDAGLSQASQHFKRVADEVLDNYLRRKPPAASQLTSPGTSHVTPPQLIEALEQLFTIIIKLDKEEGQRGRVPEDEADRLGDHGLSLLADLASWASQLGLDNARREIQKITLPIADWVVRHGARLRNIELMVDALAATANGLGDPKALEVLAQFMGRVVQAVAEPIKQDLEKANPGRPWRILNLNRGIVATRAHNTALMEQVFDDIVRYLPDDASQFFREGMQQMEALNYPLDVRAVMQRYYTAWSQHRVH